MIYSTSPAVITAKNTIRKACVDLFKTALELNTDNFNPTVEFYGFCDFISIGYSNKRDPFVFIVERFRIFGDAQNHHTQKAYIKELESCLVYIIHIKTQLMEQHAIHVEKAN